MAMPQLDPAKLQMVQELEIEMMSDMYNRLVGACHRKCIPVKYHEAELGKDVENFYIIIFYIIYYKHSSCEFNLQQE